MPASTEIHTPKSELLSRGSGESSATDWHYGEDAAATKERNGQPFEIKFVCNGGASADAGALLAEVVSKILAVAPNSNVTVARR